MTFPIIEKLDEEETRAPFFVHYEVEANGWIASGQIKCKGERDKRFWSMLQLAVESVLKTENNTIINESYTDGFSRFLRPNDWGKDIDTNV